MLDYESPMEEEDASMQVVWSPDSKDSFATYRANVDEPKVFYDGGRRLGTRRELVNNWMSGMFKEPERIWMFEKEIRSMGLMDEPPTFPRQRKGILARRTTPIDRSVCVSTFFKALSDGVHVALCLSELLNMTHGNIMPYNIHYYKGEEHVIGVVFDFDRYSRQSVEKRKADPSRPMRQLNFRHFMETEDLKNNEGSKEKRESSLEDRVAKRVKL